MSMRLIGRAPRRIGVAMTAGTGGLFYPDEGYKALSVSAGHPARIKPPQGVWAITANGDAITGVTPTIGGSDILASNGEVRFTRYYTGDESLLVKTNSSAVTCTVVLEEAPPCVIARFWRWLGWC